MPIVGFVAVVLIGAGIKKYFEDYTEKHDYRNDDDKHDYF